MRGTITYDSEFGHVCTCAATPVDYDNNGDPIGPAYTHTVKVARDIEPTEGGSYWYVCERCGTGGWSGC